MIHHLLRFSALFLLVFMFCSNCVAQARAKKYVRDLLTEVESDEKLVVECERKLREAQIAKYGKILPKISGDCFSGCPTRIVLHRYPREARRLGISGQVQIEAIVNEQGNVIYARTIKGSPFLSRSSEQSAYLSSYAPKKTCDDKPIKFRWVITYNFILNRGRATVTAPSNNSFNASGNSLTFIDNLDAIRCGLPPR